MDDNYQLFRKTTPDWVRLVFASVCALIIIAFNGPPMVRNAIGFVFVTPIQRTVHAARSWVSDKLIHSYSISSLAQRNQELIEKNQAAEIRLQAMAKDEQDNKALRAQLGLKDKTPYPMISAEALYQVVDPYMRKLVLSAGSNEGVKLGQPVVAAEGLVGQITDVKANSSEVTLVTDTKINIPIKVQRNPGVRGFINGAKSEGLLELRIFNQERTDLQPNDTLVTSGLDGLYPAELMVAKVLDIAPAGPDGRSETTIVPAIQPAQVRYVGILQIADLDEMKKRSDAQAEMARDNPVPTTLGARTREQYTKK